MNSICSMLRKRYVREKEREREILWGFIVLFPSIKGRVQKKNIGLFHYGFDPTNPPPLAEKNKNKQD